MSTVATGVHGQHEAGVPSFQPRNSLSRLNQKKKLMSKRSGGNQQPPLPIMGDINRSIEKMSLEAPPQSAEAPPRQTEYGGSGGTTEGTLLVNDGNRVRRNSSWTTVSTEGYGSMKTGNSEQISRRASELSAASQVGYKNYKLD